MNKKNNFGQLEEQKWKVILPKNLGMKLIIN